MEAKRDTWLGYLQGKWSIAGKTLLHPGPVLLFVPTGLFYYASITVEDQQLLFILNALLSISAGVIGAFIAKTWLDLAEKGVLQTKGKSAVRSLKLLIIIMQQLRTESPITLSSCLTIQMSTVSSYKTGSRKKTIG